MKKILVRTAHEFDPMPASRTWGTLDCD